MFDQFHRIFVPRFIFGSGLVNVSREIIDCHRMCTNVINVYIVEDEVTTLDNDICP